MATVAAAPLLLLAACGGGTDALDEGSGEGGGGAVVIGHQNYTEMEIMAEMYAAVLENAGFDPRLQGVDDRGLYVTAMTKGDVDVAPEYLSSMTEYLNREANGPDAEPLASPDADQTLSELDKLAGEQGLTPLEPAEAEDANAFAVTQEFSESNDVTTLSDLGGLGKPVGLAAAQDCPERPDCQLGLESVYGLKISTFEPLGFGTAQTKEAVTSGEVEVGQVGTTDGQLDTLGLVVLEDDKNWQNPENLVPVVTDEFLEANPEAEEALNELSSTLTTDDLKELNGKVDNERQLAEDVAREYLTEKGLI
jgi:osmoprotectant transport system substrate-binding protein